MAGSGFGSGAGGAKSGSAPGFVDPFSQGLLAQNTGLAEQAMHNRYQQLGLGVPSGSAPQAASQGGNLSYGGAGTAEQMDLGMLPSLTGGIPGMSAATLGQMQTNALSNATGSGTGKGGFGNLASSIGGLGSTFG